MSDPETVLACMLRGTIAQISWRQHCHLTGTVFNGDEAQLAEIVRLRESLRAIEELPEKWRGENGDYPESKKDCADELKAALAGGKHE